MPVIAVPAAEAQPQATDTTVLCACPLPRLCLQLPAAVEAIEAKPGAC
jgi:hypothetical protein